MSEVQSEIGNLRRHARIAGWSRGAPLRMVSQELADLHVQRYRSLFALSHLELNAIAFVEIFELRPGRQTAAMKENLITAVIGYDEAVALLPNDFLDGSSHIRLRRPYESPRRASGVNAAV